MTFRSRLRTIPFARADSFVHSSPASVHADAYRGFGLRWLNSVPSSWPPWSPRASTRNVSSF
ncbi:hypothetical protein RESH_04584 [Rhodopirellula europaea SH398]|uniref:Uncharacterized protein n=1 Tax=Rhodopirellula europaea SH398 TaxID=1263868 RepID=M5RZR5_9BACT|nr:hypothetical protein RESH_04584 [Rhodopirellula europaea SH398]